MTADTFDFDEFVLLLLGRDVAHGAMPYRDFMFFHPPGALVLLAGLEPITRIWWPLARIVTAAVDSLTAIMVWQMGTLLFGRREGLAGGVLYAVSPLALIAGARVGQDPIVTACGVAGLLILLRTSRSGGALLAGVMLGLAVWIKYPAIYFLPLYLLASPRRAWLAAPAAAATFALLIAPLHAEWRHLYDQTVQFQRTRWSMDVGTRLQTTALFWLAVNPFAVASLFARGRPFWLRAGFLLGGLFLFTSQVYYHYFVAIIPVAALLGAPLAARLAGGLRAGALVAGVALAVAWGEIIAHGGSQPLFVTAAHLSAVSPAVSLIEHETHAGAPVLADQYQYAYLAGRPAVAHYFWNVGVLVDAQYLEKRLPRDAAAVLSYGASSGFPAGFTAYLNRRMRPLSTGHNMVWLPPK